MKGTAPSADPRAVFESPLGPLAASFNGEAVVSLGFDAHAEPTPAPELTAPAKRLCDALIAYFERADDRAFDTLTLAPLGTPFQHRVWAALRDIPFGTTVSYGRLAESVGSPGAARAVGLANARNPIAIIVPCHRVVNSKGEPHGYAGGLERKRWLLEHESQRRQAEHPRGAQQALFAEGRKDHACS
jgi:methylated-DNA-[protein]-cysteine S-methyltransferase